MVPRFIVFAFLVSGLAAQAAEVQRLTLREAIRSALANNLQVTIAEEDRAETRAEARSHEGAFDWNLLADAQASRVTTFSAQPQPTGPDYSQKMVSTGRSLSGGLNKPFQWGGSFDFKYAPLYNHFLTTTTGSADGYANQRPYGGSLSAKYTQSLLRGFGKAPTTARLVVARKHAEAADHRFHLALIKLVADTETQYWELVFAQRNLANRRTSLELARKLLKDNTLKVELGSLAPIEIAAAESQVAKAEQEIIAGEARLRNAMDTLGRTLHPGAGRPAALEPTDEPILSHERLDEDAAIRLALQRRVELKVSRIDREVARVQERAAANRRRPRLDAFVQYDGASDNYGSLGPVNSDLTGLRNPGCTVGLTFALPIGNREAKGKHAAAQAHLSAQGLRLRDQELSIALEVRKALCEAEAAEKGVAASARTRHYQEKTLEAERIKFEHGMSTNFMVLQAMTNLDSARSEELKAQISYANAVTAMEVALGNLMEVRDFTVK